VTERLKQSHERLVQEVGRLGAELKRKNEELRRRERLAALGEMAAGLAHEIRNPLGGIALYASMLVKELHDRPDLQRAAGRISHGVRTLEQLVNDILAFAQEPRLDRQVLVFGDLLESVEDDVQPWADENGATVYFDEAAGTVALYADVAGLRRVLTNLLMNAVQAAGKDGSVWLKARSLPHDAGGEIEVSDNGPGIPRDRIGQVFNPFYTTRAEGTGLGLAIVHQIIEAHGGTIRVSSRPGGGARFVLRLPAAGEEGEDQTKAGQAAEA